MYLHDMFKVPVISFKRLVLSHLKRLLSCLAPPLCIDVSVFSVSITESEWLYVPVCYVHHFLPVSMIFLLDLGIVPTL